MDHIFRKQQSETHEVQPALRASAGFGTFQRILNWLAKPTQWTDE